MELSPEAKHAAEVVATFLGTKPASTRALWTWGPTVVVEATIDDGLTVFVKAGAAQNVHLEAAVMERARPWTSWARGPTIGFRVGVG